MAKTIILKTQAEYIRKEQIATGAITPGMTVSFAGAAGGGRRKAWAFENDLVGRGIDDDYATGEVVQVVILPTGGEINALLAAGENVTRGTPLRDAGDGTLEANNASGDDPADTIAFADEAKNNTTSNPVRIAVEVS